MVTECQQPSRTHEWIDQRSLAMGKAIAQKVRSEPSLLMYTKKNLERWIQQMQPSVPAVYVEWKTMLESWPLEKILDKLTSPDDEGRRLRQSSPFCGILSQDERLAIFREYEAISTGTHYPGSQ